MASEELIQKAEKLDGFLRSLSSKDYGRSMGSQEPDRSRFLPDDMGFLTDLSRHNNEDDYRLVLAIEGLTALQVDAILTIACAVLANCEHTNFL